jgi:CheY-like chemotaxis protein/anti-sigma regulatory factor (Ser/Thr protein kinase)
MPEAATPATTARILIVDDEPLVREVLKQMLQPAGYFVGTAHDGLEALQILERESYDLVILDIYMPRLDGLELLSELRMRWILPKVIVITGDNAPETLLRAVREEAYQYVTKPIAADDLLPLVAEVLAAPQATPPIEVISARREWVELLVPCDMAAADRIQSFMDRLKGDLPEDVRRSVGAAFRELLLNAIEWGGKFDARRKVRIACLHSKKMLMYRIADPGAGFRIEDLAHSAAANPEDPTAHVMLREERGMRPGGFGIVLAQGMVDELIYNEARNEVVLIKYL